MRRHEHVIVGAGPAGCAAAVLLARSGVPPLLLERSRAVQPRLCGEFVSAEACSALAAVGVDVAALGGQATRRLRLAHGRQVVDAELPFTAFGLTRGTLDAALQARAEAEGAVLWRGAHARLRKAASGPLPHMLQLLDADGEPQDLHARHLLLACGKTDLPRLQRRPRRAAEDLIGLQTHLLLQPEQRRALQGHVEVFLFEGGYGGLQPVEGGRVNLCLLLPRALYGGDLPAVLHGLGASCPLIAQRLEGALWNDLPPRGIFRVPYGYLHREAPGDPPRLWRLGDQAAVIPSFTGDGIAVALHSATLAAQGLLAHGEARRYHRRLHRELRWQFVRAMGLYRLGRARPARGAMLWLLQRVPGLATWLALMTRVPAAALQA